MPSRSLHPDSHACSATPLELSVEIGEGVLICAFDPAIAAGGACHISAKKMFDTAHARQLIQQFLRSLKSHGARRESLQIKLVGDFETSDIVPILAEYRLAPTTTRVTKGQWVRVEFSCSSGILHLKRRGEPRHQQQPAPRNSSPVRSLPIKVLLVDDSPSILLLLRKMIESDGGFVIVGEATSLREAESLRAREKPDVISLDLHLPDGNGADFVKQFMSISPTPTVLITAFAEDDKKHVLEALEAGVFEVLDKPSVSNYEQYAQELHATLRAAKKSSSHLHKQIKKLTSGIFNKEECHHNTLLILGASTGGTEALFSLLTALPAAVPPILVVQHIPPVFSKTFAERLNTHCAFSVKEAADDDEIAPGKCFVAQGGKHLKIRDGAGKLRLNLTIDPPVNRFRPSVDYMFNSVADLMERRSALHVVAALLTGMGDDGADGMVRLRELGACTIAQDENSSVVFGMPKMAIERGGAKHVSDLRDMPELILRNLSTRSKHEVKKTNSRGDSR